MLNLCRRPLQVLLFYLMLSWLGSMLLLGNIAVLPLLLLPCAWRQPLVQWAISAVCRIFLSGASRCGLMQLNLCALDTLNGCAGLLLLPNHPSMIDAFLILSRVRRVVCLMKASIASNLFLGAGAYLAGYVSNRQTDEMFRKAIRVAAQGQLLLVFPEGTRTQQQPVNKMSGAVALIGKKSGASLQTIIITTNSPYLSKGWKIWRPPQFPLIYQAVLGCQLEAGGPLAQTTHCLQRYFEEHIHLSIDPDLHLDR